MTGGGGERERAAWLAKTAGERLSRRWTRREWGVTLLVFGFVALVVAVIALG